MSTVVHLETQAQERLAVPQDPESRGRWRTRGLLAAVAIAVIGTAATFISGATSPVEPFSDLGRQISKTEAQMSFGVDRPSGSTGEESDDVLNCEVIGLTGHG